MLSFVRVWMPVALMVAGIAWIAVGGASVEALEIGIPVFSAGASIWFVNFLWRIGVSGDKDRDVEDEARQYYARHGRWPDERGDGKASR